MAVDPSAHDPVAAGAGGASGRTLPPAIHRLLRAAWVPPVVCGVAMVALAGLATFAHASRWTIGPWRDAPLGIVLACGAVLAGAATARAWAGYWGVVASAAGAFVVTQLMAMVGPGGDVLISAQPLGYAWLVVAPAATVGVAFAPAHWFTDPPDPNQDHPDDEPDLPPSG
ncbi:MAG: hypothetical protein LBK72_04430 [Bifidobacteriaceae bacterium]|jgi:hypothetical protein|nr:hypothetical protein [Bifidobacteriaceae bacterium]